MINSNSINLLNYKKISLLFFLIIGLYSNTALAGWPEVPTPPSTETTPLAKQILYQGIPMRIKNFTSEVSLERTLEFYRQQWEKEFVENKYQAWHQISHKDDEYFITIQVQASGDNKAFGRISIMQLQDKDAQPVALGKGIPILPDSIVMNDISSNDNETKSRNIIAQNKRSIQSNARYYEKEYTAAGWGNMMNKQVKKNSHVLMFRKGRKESVVVLHKIGDTSYIQINESEKTPWFN